MKFTQMMERFAAPAHDERPAVMWFWNDAIDREGIRAQLTAFRRAGFTDFYVHPLWGNQIEYLSDAFFKMVKYTVSVAKELGMYYHIYDEYNWPSGNAGGKLLREEPWTASKKLVVTRVSLFAGQPADCTVPGSLVAAQIVYGDKQESVRDVTGEITIGETANGTRVGFVNDTCVNATLYVSSAARVEGMSAAGMWSRYSRFDSGALDANNPAAVRRFIEYTHERYKEAIGAEFGKTVRGLFTDETSTLMLFDHREGVFPWTDGFSAAFEKDHGYALSPRLHELMRGGEPAFRLRCHYWQTVTRLFRDSYLKQVAQWCRENKLRFTGHLSGEGMLYYHAYQMGDFYESLSQIDAPGIDSIFSAQAVDDPEYAIEAALVSSVAKFAGRRRVMCETFSGSGWDMTLAQMKRIMHKLLLGGINDFVYMGAYYSLDGARKRFPLGYPPSHGYNNPLFSHYERMGEYIGRLCALSRATTPQADVLVLLPQHNQYMGESPREEADRTWRATVRALLARGVPFDFLFETLSPDTTVTDDRIVLRGFAYDTLIVPETRYTDENTARLIERFSDGGGRVLFVNAVPALTTDTARRLALFDLREGDNGGLIYSAAGSGAYIRSDLSDPDAAAAYESALYEFVEGQRRAIALENPAGLFAAHRRCGDADVFLIANDTDREICARGSIRASGRAVILDPQTGETRPVALRQDGGRRYFSLTLPGYGLTVIACGQVPACEPERAADGKPIHTDTLGGPYRFEAAGGNVLPLGLKLSACGDKLLAASDGGDERQIDALALQGCLPGAAPQELSGGGGLRYGDRYAAVCNFGIEKIPQSLTLFAELEEEMAVYLNGKKLTDFAPCALWGPRDACIAVESAVRDGENTLAVVSRIPAWSAPHAIPTVFVRGDFSVTAEKAIGPPVRRIQPQPWTMHGYPYFSGDGVYETEFTVGRRGAVFVGIQTADAVRVFVNGEQAGTLLWPPYQIDITALTRPGRNTLRLEVTSTYSNLMDYVRITTHTQGSMLYAEDAVPGRSGLLAPVELRYQTNTED